MNRRSAVPGPSEASEFELEHVESGETDGVAASEEGIVTTSPGNPVSRRAPNRTKPETLYGIDRGRLEILGDIVAPIDVEWDAETGSNWDDLL